MSMVLLDFAKKFLENKFSAEIFSEAYMELWKIEGEKGILAQDSPALNECLSGIFCAADMFCASDDFREEYELDEEKLRAEVLRLIVGCSDEGGI